MRNTLLIIILVAAGYAGLKPYWEGTGNTREVSGVERSGDGGLVRVQGAGTNGAQVQGQGRVIKVLPDDNEGSRHQKFIVKLGTGQTLLIAHNIDIAPRISSLRVGDHVAFNGEFERNAEGGVIHWTHHDPGGRHAGGWLKHGNQTYQ